jgi:hypothetical protein
VTNDDLVRLAALVEAKVPVETWTVDGVHVWPLVRAQLLIDNFFMYHREAPKNGTNGARSSRLLAKLGPLRPFAGDAVGWVRATLRDRAASARLAKTFALLYSDGVSFVSMGGRYYERFCDPVREQLEARGKSALMVTPLGRYLTPRYTPSVFVQPRMDLAHLKGMVTTRLRRAHDSSFEGWDEAVAIARDAFPKVVLRERPHFERSADYVRAFGELHERMLDATDPRVVFVVSYYGAEAMALIRACRARGIATVDVQHGTIAATHWAYARWSRLPAGGFELLPRWFWVWSESEAQVIREWAHASGGAHAPLVGGNLFLSMWRDGTASYVREADQRMTEIGRRMSNLPLVIYTTNRFESPKELSRLRDAIARSRGRLGWWVRLHPAAEPATRTRFSEELRPVGGDGLWIDDGAIPLYGILRHVALHVTELSSTAIEAAEFGVPTILLAPDEAEMYADLIARGWAVTIDRDEDLADTAIACLTRKGRPASSGSARDPFDVLLEEAASC